MQLNLHYSSDVCLSDPCLHGGTCTDSNGDYSCSCLTGFTGGSCEIFIDGGMAVSYLTSREQICLRLRPCVCA